MRRSKQVEDLERRIKRLEGINSALRDEIERWRAEVRRLECELYNEKHAHHNTSKALKNLRSEVSVVGRLEAVIRLLSFKPRFEDMDPQDLEGNVVKIEKPLD